MFGRRPDATLVRDVHPVRRFMPFISPRRGESLFWFSYEAEVDRALDFVDRYNDQNPEGPQLTLFHVVLRALSQGFQDWPRMNRFTAGGRTWQRNEIWITFSAKLRMDEDAPVVTVKRRFDPSHSLEQMVEAIHSGLRESRSGKPSTSDKEVGLLLRLPPFVIRGIVAVARALNSLGLLPKAMIDSDPMFCSAFVANLGSVGLEGGYHHLWEYGTCPIFLVIGRVTEGPDGKRRISMKWTFDERVEDGLYAGRGLQAVRERIENPEKL